MEYSNSVVPCVLENLASWYRKKGDTEKTEEDTYELCVLLNLNWKDQNELLRFP